MKRQYMDFMPAGRVKKVRKSTEKVVEVASETPKTVTSKTVVTKFQVSKSVAQIGAPHEVAERDTKKRSIAERDATLALKQNLRLGAIEEVNPKFVKTDMPKRPLGETAHFRLQKTEIAKVKAEKIGNQAKADSKADLKADLGTKKAEGLAVTEKAVYEPPKPQFINQEKIVKRPLSKNVYPKKSVEAKETAIKETKEPVAIIAKPEKQAHAGLIVTIILTIILGAAAGTVAFLLLPK